MDMINVQRYVDYYKYTSIDVVTKVIIIFTF